METRALSILRSMIRDKFDHVSYDKINDFHDFHIKSDLKINILFPYAYYGINFWTESNNSAAKKMNLIY